ncbi:nuclear pore complex protein Nup205 [Harmonia axyridis]|uniref:nuclear pore complex protein Nup205 n=1 Tax=Harmonia axyridis TaxID=115357 RepID=UPI001E275BD9|nr:nuclear pore complex protein Nup205 [Harmonia axyridis]
MAEVFMKSEDLWNPSKDLQDIVFKHLTQSSSNLCNSELESALRKHKQSFFSLLKNPPKNAKSREEIKKGMTEGITVRGLGHQILSQELYQETIIISDMFDINEFVALDLLCTAQLQVTYHPGLPRGLVAVLLYYDGRKALLTALKCLVQARNGVQWSVNIKEEVARFITIYTDQLMEGGLFTRIFELLRELDLSKELEKLHQNVALGGPKHRKQVKDLFLDIRNLLGDIVFIWATQCGLPKAPTLGLIDYLREVKGDEEASGKLDSVNLTLQMALLSALDLSILHTREDGEEIVKSLPILSQKNYLEYIIKEFGANKPKWNCEGLEALSTFGIAVCIASLRLLCQNQQFQEFIGKEEIFIDKAIELNVFDFLNNMVLDCNLLYEDEFMYKRMHYLLTDFIVYLYPKVKELRIKADESARTIQVYIREGLEAPVSLPRHFENLLLSIAKLYQGNKLKNTYVLDYWSPIEINPDQSYSYHAPPRAVSLFKFVRFAGDMLPSTLFVPYVSFLSSLSTCQQAARNCFNMLKQVGLLPSSTISWDHFFVSFAQYYSNLREESPPLTDTIYGQKGSYHRAVSPLEIKGLQSVLVLIRTVAEHDEFSRLALCEHPGWAPLTVLLGLVGCSIPIPLKAELLLTLATLSKSPENASQMWENLEASQILITIPSISGYTPRGIETELEEVESRDEEYPLTKAFLKLLDSLTDLGIPRMLGAGPRKPGFTPYLTFVVNSVFLRYHARSYKDPSERWEVAMLCLKLFEKFLKHYDPQIADISPDDTTKEFHTPPGFHLMIQFNNKTDLLNLILDIVHDGCAYFNQFVSFPGEDMLKQCVLHCLNIIHRVLLLQGSFSNIVAASSEPILLTGIMKLLLTINRKSGKPDHCINIAKYVNCQYHLPEHANSSIKVLRLVLSSPVAHSHFVSMLFSMEDMAKDIKFGFIECLDEAQTEDNEQLNLSTKLEILKLLKQCVVFNAPNFSHYLLGFDIKQDISKSNLLLPGVNDYPRSCLHSIFVLFNIAVRESISDQLLESIYNMLHILCSNAKTSGPVLRFIKSNENFFITHLKYSYKHLKSMQSLRQASWLMKTVAIELKVCSTSKQVKYLKQLSNFLTGYPSYDIGVCNDTFALISKPTLSDSGPAFAPISFDEPDFFMLNLTEHFESRENEMEMPTWEIFNNSVLENLLKSCQTEATPKLINIKKLHQILNDELKNFQGTAIIGQMQAINQEIPKVLKYALEVNKCREESAAVVQFVEAWCQIIDVIVIYIPFEILSPIDKQYLCIQLLVKLLKTVTVVDIVSEANKLISGTILLLLSNLQQCHLQEKKLNKVSNNPKDLYVIQANSDTLKEILRLLMKWIVASNIVSEKLRINIYACLMIFLQLTHIDQENEGIFVPNSSFVSRLDSTKLNLSQLDDTTINMPTDVINDFGEKLVEILCHDCISSHDMCKVLAMTSLGQLVYLTGNMNWIAFMSGRGYIKHIIQSIFESDNDLLNLLEPSSTNMKSLYVYSAKIAFLIKLAGNRMGAELLLEHNLLSCLSNMKVFGHHPEINKTWDFKEDISQFTPSLEEQYLQIWLPSFDLCNALLTTLGCDNKSALVQILFYVLSHMDVVELVLRSGSPELSTVSLKELSLITSVLSRSANNELINIMENPDLVQSNRAQLYRLQKLIFALLPKFILTESVIRNLIHNTSNSMLNTYQTSQRLLYGMQVICNLLSYCRSIVANHGIDHTGVGVIFEPSLNTVNNTQSAYEQTPSLGVIVQHLISAVSYHHQEKVTLDRLHRKIKDIPEMSSMDLREFVNESLKVQDLTSIREQILDFTREKLESKEREIKYCTFIIEHALYLTWVHLDYYMLKAIPRAKHFGPLISRNSSNLNESLPSATEATWKVSTDDISNLKQGLVSIFNDSFTKQLLETLQDLPESDKGLAEALLRKIKRLIQFVPVK